MRILKTLGIGILIWIFGVTFYILSFYVPLLENLEQQANGVLFVVVAPLVWVGAWLYYKNGSGVHGLKLGLVLFMISAVLDALITVPFLIMPCGGSYFSFFIDWGFWLIAVEFVTVAFLYWYAQLYLKQRRNNKK